MMLLNSFMQQIPVLTSADFLTITDIETNRPPPFDPLAEIRNGKKKFFYEEKC